MLKKFFLRKENPKRACRGVTLSVKLDVIKCPDGGEQNKDIVCALNFRSGNAHIFFMEVNGIAF